MSTNGEGNGQVVVPDRVGYDLGWRAFSVSGEVNGDTPGLRSVIYKTVWPHFRPMIATCTRDHDVPDKDHTCGLYIARTLRDLFQMPERYHFYDGEQSGMWCVVAEVALWGPRVPATFGWRAAYAYPQRLLVPYEIWRQAPALREAYGAKTILFNFRAPKVKRMIDAQKGK